MNGYYDQLVKLLKNAGFAFLRPGKGSHEIWARGSVKVTVPRGSRSKFLANQILKDAGLKDRIA